MQREIDLSGRQAAFGTRPIEGEDAVAHARRRSERRETSRFLVRFGENGECAIADQLQHIAAMRVNGRNDDLGVIVEERNNLLRRGAV